MDRRFDRFRLERMVSKWIDVPFFEAPGSIGHTLLFFLAGREGDES